MTRWNNYPPQMPHRVRLSWERFGRYGPHYAIYDGNYSNSRGRLYKIHPMNPSSYYVYATDCESGKTMTFAIGLMKPVKEKEAMCAKIVEFKIPSKMRDTDANRRALSKAMGITEREWAELYGNGGQITCRADQFGLFVCYREEFGIDCNRIKELNPVVKIIEGYDKKIDVTDR